MKQIIEMTTDEDTETSRQVANELKSRPPEPFSVSPPLLESLSRFAARLWYSLLWCPCWVISQLWFRYRYAGRSQVPMSGPVLLVSNHQSHLDPVLVGIACPRQLKYLARHDLFFWPFSWWIRALGAVPIDRQRGALAGIKTTLKLLQQGESVLVFPEGTRTPHGKLNALLPGFCLLARRSRATIVPVAIRGAYDAMPRGSTFPKPQPIRLTFGESLAAEQYAQITDAELTAVVSHRIAEALS